MFKKNTLYPLLLLVGLLIPFQLAAVYPYVFRTDGGFNKINLDSKEVVLKHTVKDGSMTVFIDNEEVSVSAVDRISFRKTDIPTFHFNFFENKELQWVESKTNYIPADLDIEGGGLLNDEFGLGVFVKSRGNTTWYMPKKPMRMKFSYKISVCGFPLTKNYVLIANYVDPTHMRNAVALWLARRLGLKFTNHTMPCHAYANDVYAGLYLFTEKIGINSASVDIDERTGVLLELSSEFDEPYKFRSSIYNLPVMVKDPDFDELFDEYPMDMSPADRISLWKQDFENAERLVADGHGDEVFDMQSAVDYYLVMNFAKNNEIGFPKSVYVFKEALGVNNKYVFGPVWDFDVAFNFTYSGTPGDINQPVGDVKCFNLLEKLKEHPVFQELYKARLIELRDVIYPELKDWCKDYADQIAPAARLDGIRWPLDVSVGSWGWRVSPFDTRKRVSELMEWMDARVKYLSGENVENATDSNVPSSSQSKVNELTGLVDKRYIKINTYTSEPVYVEIVDGMEVRLTSDMAFISDNNESLSYQVSEISNIQYVTPQSMVEDVAIGEAAWSASTSGGVLHISASSPVAVSIFSVSGALLRSMSLEGEVSVEDLPTGIYIVTGAGQSKKVAL